MTKKAVVSQLREHDKYERLIAATRDLPAAPHRRRPSLRRELAARCARGRRGGADRSHPRRPQGEDQRASRSLGLDIARLEIVDVPHSQAAAEKAVELVRKGTAELLMKGSLHSDELLGAVAKRETGLRTGRRISHVFVMDVPDPSGNPCSSPMPP